MTARAIFSRTRTDRASSNTVTSTATAAYANRAARRHVRAASARRADPRRTAGPHGLTADEVADILNRSVLSIRPRISELLTLGLIKRNDERRKNRSGLFADAYTEAELHKWEKTGASHPNDQT